MRLALTMVGTSDRRSNADFHGQAESRLPGKLCVPIADSPNDRRITERLSNPQPLRYPKPSAAKTFIPVTPTSC